MVWLTPSQWVGISIFAGDDLDARPTGSSANFACRLRRTTWRAILVVGRAR